MKSLEANNVAGLLGAVPLDLQLWIGLGPVPVR